MPTWPATVIVIGRDVEGESSLPQQIARLLTLARGVPGATRLETLDGNRLSDYISILADSSTKRIR
jgi:hypothetical protein